MTRHHAMLTYWRDTSQPNDRMRVQTIADDDPEAVAEGIDRHLRRLMAAAGPEPRQVDEVLATIREGATA